MFLQLFLLETVPMDTDMNCIVVRIALKFPIKPTVGYLFVITFPLETQTHTCFDVLLTLHLSIILVINQLNAQNLVL